MNRCRWDREQETYLRDGEPCKVDDYGDPTVHCTARRSCGNHIGRGELTCARCIGRVRSCPDTGPVVTRWCERCELWWSDDDLCWLCGDPGIPARAAHASARSWRNPATWTPPTEDTP